MIYMTQKNRDFIRMALTSDAKDRLNTLADERDMKLMGVTTRLVEWFVDQDPFLQSVILGQVPDQDKIVVIELIRNRLKDSSLPGSPEYESDKATAKRIRPQNGVGHKPDLWPLFVQCCYAVNRYELRYTHFG